MNGRTEMVKLLLDKGASVKAADEEGRTALEGALNGGHTDVAKLLEPFRRPLRSLR